MSVVWWRQLLQHNGVRCCAYFRAKLLPSQRGVAWGSVLEAFGQCHKVAKVSIYIFSIACFRSFFVAFLFGNWLNELSKVQKQKSRRHKLCLRCTLLKFLAHSPQRAPTATPIVTLDHRQ